LLSAVKVVTDKYGDVATEREGERDGEREGEGTFFSVDWTSWGSCAKIDQSSDSLKPCLATYNRDKALPNRVEKPVTGHPPKR
jgi:hypothetical protein